MKKNFFLRIKMGFARLIYKFKVNGIPTLAISSCEPIVTSVQL